MSKRESIERINLIINCLRKRNCSFKEVLNYLEAQSIFNEYDYSISQKTFKRDLELIASMMSIEIEFDKSSKKYKIVSDSDDEIKLRITEAYETFNALKIADDVSNFLHFEKRKAIGTEFLNIIIFSIKTKKILQLDYQKYWDLEVINRKVKPLALKENNHRWYLIAMDENGDKIKTFGLDRMKNVKPTSISFEYPYSVSIEDKFKDSFGVISDENIKTEKIILALTPYHAKYVKSLPIHHSQIVVSENEVECVIQFYLKPTEDLIMEILSMGTNVKVVEPKSLKLEIKKRLIYILSQY